ncbi:serine/threonine protein kinase [Paenibacillus cisolokensis]|uniref:serine/threonine protein kinase n=1 Tax=Paenibacillus cisolokensis TaxID=1658519 RepID=UPI003D2AF195
MTTSFELGLRRGVIVTGKWNRGRYRVERMLGEGANGKVFLVQRERDKGWYALKVGANAVDLQSEINVLKSLAGQNRSSGTGSFLIDVDDLCAMDGSEHPFYVMRYVRGATLSEYLERSGPEWFPLVGYNLLLKLSGLHDAGWAFGDLKVENVLVADYGRVELVDYGGVTAFGKSVRQFTEIYDRGYWNAGSRTADAGYDLFSFAVMCIQLHEKRKLAQMAASLLPQNRSPEELMKLVQHNNALRPLSGWLGGALTGRFANGREAAAAWQRLMHRPDGNRRAGAVPGWMKAMFMASAALLAVTIYWYVRS